MSLNYKEYMRTPGLTKNISINGLVDVKNYAWANINVSSVSTEGGAMIKIKSTLGATVSCDNVIGTEQSGIWCFPVGLGSHTVVASKNGKTKTETVNCNMIWCYEVDLTLLNEDGI